MRPFPNTEAAKWQVSTAGGGEPHWSHDGRSLFYVASDYPLDVVEVMPGPTFVTGRRRLSSTLRPTSGASDRGT